MNLTLLHGALGAQSQLEPLAQELKKQGIKTTLIELPGHGNFNLQNHHKFSIDGFADWLGQTLTEKKIQNDPFFGFSMGGYIGLYLCAARNLPKNKIITLGTKFKWTPESAKEEVKSLNPKKILEKVPDFGEMLNKRHYDWEEVMSNTKALMLGLGEKPLFQKDEAQGIKNEVLILRGEADKMVSEKESLEVADNLPNGRYKELPALPHPIERLPVAHIAEEIITFIR